MQLQVGQTFRHAEFGEVAIGIGCGVTVEPGVAFAAEDVEWLSIARFVLAQIPPRTVASSAARNVIARVPMLSASVTTCGTKRLSIGAMR